MGFPDEYFFEEGCYISEWLNHPGDAGVSVAHVRVPADGVTRWHALREVTERYLVITGEGLAEVGERRLRLRPGDSVIIPPGQRQRIRNTGAGELKFLAICTPRFTTGCYRDLEQQAG